jgi:S-DNA-T family DNA segregation ATPase FtsK/SpoIIIE
MHTQELTNRLVNLDEGTYGDWTPDRLAEALADAGVERSTTQVKIDGVNRNGYWKSDLQAAAEQYGSTD